MSGVPHFWPILPEVGRLCDGHLNGRSAAQAPFTRR